MNYSLVSLKTSKLNKNKIIQISNLKDSQWRLGINSQIEWFKKILKKMIFTTCCILNLNSLDTLF